MFRDWRAGQGETTRWAFAHKAEQRSLARQARCNRVHSAVTYQVNVIEVEEANKHAVFLKFASGQLPFLGLSEAPTVVLRPVSATVPYRFTLYPICNVRKQLSNL